MERAVPRGAVSVACALLTGAVLLLASGVAAVDGDPGDGEHSRIARLAPQSLLLGASRAGDRLVVVGERGHVLLSDDRGATWRLVVVPTRSTLTAVHFPSARRGFAVGHDAVILRSTDGGGSWERQHWDPQLESPLLDVWFADEERGFAVGAYGLFLETRDGGGTWNARPISDVDVHHNAIVSTGGGVLFIVGERGSVFRSDDGGERWAALASPDRTSFFGALALPGGGLLAFGLQGRAYRSGDGGETWAQVPTGTEASLMGGAVTERGTLVLGGIAGAVLIGALDGPALTRVQRPDRKVVAAALPLPGEGVLLLGAFGVADASALLDGVPSATAPRPAVTPGSADAVAFRR